MTTSTLPERVATNQDTLWAMGIHLGALILAFCTSWFLGAAGMLVGLAVLLLRPGNSEFVAEHAKEALNFNLSMFLWAVGAVFLTIFTLGLGLIIVIPGMIVLAIAWFVCSILAAMAARQGRAYRYPFTWRIV